MLKCHRVVNLLNASRCYPSLRIDAYPKIYKQPTSLTSYKAIYNFVNIPISSKFYHEPLPTIINPILSLLVKQKQFNEKAVILQHLSDLLIEDQRIILSKDQLKVIKREVMLWKGRKGRFERVVTIAWIIKRLGWLKEFKQLHYEIAERVSNDQWYVNFDESIKALEAFSTLKDEQLRKQILPRIQRNIMITVWEVNMKYYKRIVTGLIDAGRNQSELWQKLEKHILTNLSMEYSVQTITDIFRSYVMAGQGSQNFYLMMQKVLYQGHWYQNYYKKKLIGQHFGDGQFFALLVETYAVGKQNTDIIMLPEFCEFIYEGVMRSSTNYHKLSSFTKIIQFLPFLQFDQEDNQQIITNLLTIKRPSYITYQDIRIFYEQLQRQNIKIPFTLQQFIENSLLKDFNDGIVPPSMCIEICEEMVGKGLVVDQQKMVSTVQKILQKKWKYMEVEEAKAVLQLTKNSPLLQFKKSNHSLLLSNK